MTESPLPSRTGLKTPRHWPLSPIQEPPFWVRDRLGPEQTLYPGLLCLARAPKILKLTARIELEPWKRPEGKRQGSPQCTGWACAWGWGRLWPPGAWPSEGTGLKEQDFRTSQHRNVYLANEFCHEGKGSRVAKPPPHICLLTTQVCMGIFCLVDWPFQVEEHFKSQENVESVFHSHNQVRKWANTSFSFCLFVPSLDIHSSLTRGIGLSWVL